VNQHTSQELADRKMSSKDHEKEIFRLKAKIEEQVSG